MMVFFWHTVNTRLGRMWSLRYRGAYSILHRMCLLRHRQHVLRRQRSVCFISFSHFMSPGTRWLECSHTVIHSLGPLVHFICATVCLQNRCCSGWGLSSFLIRQKTTSQLLSNFVSLQCLSYSNPHFIHGHVCVSSSHLWWSIENLAYSAKGL